MAVAGQEKEREREQSNNHDGSQFWVIVCGGHYYEQLISNKNFIDGGKNQKTISTGGIHYHE